MPEQGDYIGNFVQFLDGNNKKRTVSPDFPLPVTGGGGGGGNSTASPAIFLDAMTLYQEGYTPDEDGTIMIQNLCKTCYYEGYDVALTSVPVPLNADPSTFPMISVAPESWAWIPLKQGVSIAFLMNGYAGPEHLEELRIIFQPGLMQINSGKLERHYNVSSDMGYENVAFAASSQQIHTLMNIPPNSNKALVTVMTGTVKMGLLDSTTAPEYSEGDTIQLANFMQISALRMSNPTAAESIVRVDYWRE